ncbi:Vacuolar protein sorting-associated protein VTA1-like protein [Trichoplax sp. H2]|nr:Vacuolar protein sorting-associated protein VTA1-like protein [Trichoplax sp. H2]|eukprot:RDD41842.1 Vacuolar protein sorting-associated protein VTA1-like protein [Trichoplax sp. H2]
MASQCPAELKTLLPLYKISLEFSKRDPVICYYAQLYVVQNGLKQSTKNIEVKKFLMTLMDGMEGIKSSGNEAITNEVAGQAHVENIAMKLFLHADTEDRASRFNKNVIKAFYTASLIFEMLTLFGELTDEVQRNKKYAKWKAAYIAKCLKSGEAPIPGPVGGDDDPFSEFGDFNQVQRNKKYAKWKAAYIAKCLKSGETPIPGPVGGDEDPFSEFGDFNQVPPPSDSFTSNNTNMPSNPPAPGFNTEYDMPSPSNPSFNEANFPPQQPSTQNYTMPTPSSYDNTAAATGNVNVAPTSSNTGVTLSPQDSDKAQKFCRYAISALQYEDTPTAIENLQKALRLLQTGKL